MKHRLGFEIGGQVGSFEAGDAEAYVHGVGQPFPELEIRKQDMDNSISFSFDRRPPQWMPFSRAAARAIANDILELLGPETDEDRAARETQEYRRPL